MEWQSEGGPEGEWHLPISSTHSLFVWWASTGSFGYGVHDQADENDPAYPWSVAPDLATAQRCARELWETGPVERKPRISDAELDELLPF